MNDTLLNPFRLFGRLMIAMFKITGYTTIFAIQIPWLYAVGRRGEVAEEFGEWGRYVVDALADIVSD